ncbi:hypothetical protein CEXT_755161 [Caerostris extrusa]|uniref:Uncharacterized protein n=1 Tax=Caerostris extrusa TaxID=172846 RepID=A0AAV4UCY7_CAEEX|nr:hypothetical protein CEXT_755161 [Caerostris extrusa]
MYHLVLTSPPAEELHVFLHRVGRRTLYELAVVGTASFFSQSSRWGPIQEAKARAWNVGLLKDAPEEMGHGSMSIDWDIFTSMGIPSTWYSALLDEVFVL